MLKTLTAKKLQRKLHRNELEECCVLAGCNVPLIDKLCAWAVERDDRVASSAAWILSHADTEARYWIIPWQYRMAQKAQVTGNIALRRLLLTVLLTQPLEEYKLSDSSFLDWCLFIVVNPAEPAGVRSLCIKHALACASAYPDLLRELCLVLESLLQTSDSSAVCTAARTALCRAQHLIDTLHRT